MTVLLYFSSNPTEGCLKNKQCVLVFLLRSNTVVSLLLWMKKRVAGEARLSPECDNLIEQLARNQQAGALRTAAFQRPMSRLRIRQREFLVLRHINRNRPAGDQ